MGIDFQKCYAGADLPNECSLQKDDYLECLHHTKEARLFLSQRSVSHLGGAIANEGACGSCG